MISEQDLLKLREAFLRVFNGYIELNKKPRSYGTDELLYSSELVMLELIGHIPGMNVTELAQKQNVTKGAVSQTLKKLDEKGLIEKRKDKDNREVSIILSRKGEKIFHQHRLYELEFAEEFFSMTETMTQKEFEIIYDYVNKINFLFEKAMERD